MLARSGQSHVRYSMYVWLQMAETPLHHYLALEGITKARRDSRRVQRSTVDQRLPSPRPVGRHEPDAEGFDLYTALRVEAKRGPELFSRHTQEQLRDFTRQPGPRGLNPHLYLAVPRPWRSVARKAVKRAGGNPKRATVIPVLMPPQLQGGRPPGRPDYSSRLAEQHASRRLTDAPLAPRRARRPRTRRAPLRVPTRRALRRLRSSSR